MFDWAIITVSPIDKNKTLRWLLRNESDKDRIKVFIPDHHEKLAEEYKMDGLCVITYSTDGLGVDTMGSSSCACAAEARLGIEQYARTNKVRLVCLDDDYGSINWGNSSVKNLDRLKAFLNKLFEFQRLSGWQIGGYSGGTAPRPVKLIIMNIFLIDYEVENRILRDKYNEDVNNAIYSWRRGVPCFGFGYLRIGAQTGELDKPTGNTKEVYSEDYSWKKSFGSVLVAPNHATVKVNVRGKRAEKSFLLRPRWHHEVKIARIKPRIIYE